MDQEFSYIKLIDEPSTKDKFVRAAFLKVMQIKGIRNRNVTPDTIDEKNRTFQQQTHSYVENGETIYRHIDCKENLIDTIPDVNNVCQLMNSSINKCAKKPFLGTRPIINEYIEETEDGRKTFKYELGDYNWITYNEAENILNHLSLLYFKHGSNSQYPMALFTDTSSIWFLSAHALLRLKCPVVTLYSTLTDDNILYCLNLTESTAILLDAKTLPRLLPIIERTTHITKLFLAPGCGTVENIKVSDTREIEVIKIDLDSYRKPLSADLTLKYEQPSPKDLALIMFTSGSSGIPKGVMITHENILASLGSIIPDPHIWSNRTYCAYLPQAHILEFTAENVIAFFGGKIGFGKPFTLTDASPMIKKGTKGDLTVLRPDFFASVPLLMERIKKAVYDKLKKSPTHKQIIFETAYNLKMDYLKAGKESSAIDQLVFKKLHKVLGGRVKNIYVGGASLNVKTQNFFNACFAICQQGYGLTETTCAGSLGKFEYWRQGNVGAVVRCIELKLIPWDEGKYYPEDPNGPRGEVLISGKSVSLGYYKNQEETDKAYITDEKTGKRWFKTGDIAQILPDGSLRIIDRKKDIIKLKHGEYISLVLVEESIMQSPLVDLVCVCANSTSEYLVALVVPNRLALIELASKNIKSIDTSNENALIETAGVQKLVDSEIRSALTVDTKLTKYSIPQKIIILTDLWTPESGLITPSAKLRRPIIAEKYKELIV